MGCVVSKRSGGGEDVVSLCKERKWLLKLAVERRYAFADAQAKYNQSLYGVAMALSFFIAKHSSPSSPFLITLPPTPSIDTKESFLSDRKFLLHTPSEPIKEVLQSYAAKEQVTQEGNESASEVESGCEDGGEVCEHFYDDVAPKMPSSKSEYGWDFFFSPFDEGEVAVTKSGSSQILEGDLRDVREKEGIPELEEDGGERSTCNSENVVVNKKGDKEGSEAVMCSGVEDSRKEILERNSLIGTPASGRELLDALKDIVDHFLKAYNSGSDVSKMLEVNRFQMHSGLEEIKESSSKLIRSITMSRSTLSRSSSRRSLLTTGSVSSSTWSESKINLFDDYGMHAGSHSLTLERLYAWEKKLCEEVKAGDQTRRRFERKCSNLSDQDAVGDNVSLLDNSRGDVKDLHAKISVSMRRVETISNRVQKLRDEELHPQLLELLHGLMRNWKMMSELHETQMRVMLQVKSLNCSAYGKFCNDSHRLATIQLQAELDNWHCCFIDFVAMQKAYLEALCGWLSKFIAPGEVYPNSKCAYGINGPPLLVTCHDWLASLEKLPDKLVTCAMKRLGKHIRTLCSQQGEELQQKRKVDGLAKDLIKRALAYETAERQMIESNIAERGFELTVHHHIAHLVERKNILDMFKSRLEAEKGKHLAAVQETERLTLDGFQSGFSLVFESLTQFSRVSAKMYSDLVTCSNNVKGQDQPQSNVM